MLGGVALGSAAAVPPTLLLADVTNGGSPNLVQIITGLGLPTAVIVAWIMGWICSGRELQRVLEDRDAERAERIRLSKILSDRAVPGLNRQAAAFEQAFPLVQEGARLREALPLLEHLARQYASQYGIPPAVQPVPDEG